MPQHRNSNSLTSSFSVSDANNEVVCPLKNHDGTSCRKRCIGEKRYRSMQEHIRRAHPEHYLPKLPATEESFMLMVNTPPSERPPPPAPPVTSAGPTNYTESIPYYDDFGSSSTNRATDDVRRGSMLPAAAALAQLHTHRPEPEQWFNEDAFENDWGGGLATNGMTDALQLSDSETKAQRPKARLASMSLEQQMAVDEPYFTPTSRPRELLPSSLARSPPGRSTTLPPGLKAVKPNRPRKPSLGQNARKPKHERQKSKEHARLMNYDRKAFSAEPQSAAALYGKRWEDLIDAAASATEEDSRDLTPVPPSPQMLSRSSVPPYMANQMQSYTASPLQHTLTPPPPETNDLQPFPSVESSIDSAVSGQNFHMPSQGLSDSSPTRSYPVQIYCAACRKLSILRNSYACTECICGLCQDCVEVLVTEQARARPARCPRCSAVGGKYKPFMLDIR
ncbi:hypothetical protein EJ05DRAFT_531851 [Pseudovirgaria hyperparasitica]|uniref:RING zinc finger-like domain-containing protein n=1 Tax=Pseudovirgaria hyperparasitica TaxID=470096 RepID=A0A6A6W8A5_9PEZI|nr:uncharacterized protein EJ05DRAFT_531851 [Pseudovirgaria hyperparasitica]KAF2758116.1 hypothetical protein EJ05DRAFT_531851 [Pseudovirgaria hyperparasitica]